MSELSKPAGVIDICPLFANLFSYKRIAMDFDRDGGHFTISQVQGNIQSLSQQVQELDAFIPRLSDYEHGDRNREQFNEMAHKAQRLSKDTNLLMRKLVDMSNNERSLRIHRERLQNEYMAVLNRLQATQRRAAQTEKASMKQAQQAAEHDAEAARHLSQQDSDRERQLQIQRQQQVNLQDFKERQHALQQLEQDIGDVNQIFADLARIVHEQGDLVDSIEANVENAHMQVDQGAINVQQAVYYNQQARKKKLMLFTFLVLLIFIIGLTIYLAR